MSEFTLRYEGRQATFTADLGVSESELGPVYLEAEVIPRHDSLIVNVFDRNRASGCQLVGEIVVQRDSFRTVVVSVTTERELYHEEDGTTLEIYDPNKRPYETHADEWRKREEDPAA